MDKDQLREIMDIYFDAKGVKMDNNGMEWVDISRGREYRRPCGYAVGGVVETDDGRYAAKMSHNRIVRHFDSMREAMTWVMEQFNLKGVETDSMDYNTDNVKAMDRRNDGVVILTCEDRKNLSVYLTPKQVETIANWYNAANSVTVEPETTVLRVNSIELADYGEILLKLEGETCGDGVVDTVVYVGPKHIKEIAEYYNEKHSVTVEPEYHEGIMLDTDGLVKLHNRMLKTLLDNENAPANLLDYVLAIRKQIDNENYWQERIARLNNL